MSKTFIKTKEDFICEHCGVNVIGNGFTNHCPVCLWSKHVDVFPGDREAKCVGMMKPIKLEKEKKNYILVHECVICGYVKRNKMAPEDDFDKAVILVKQNKES